MATCTHLPAYFSLIHVVGISLRRDAPQAFQRFLFQDVNCVKTISFHRGFEPGKQEEIWRGPNQVNSVAEEGQSMCFGAKLANHEGGVT